ncbi:hypothetical protein Tco_0614438 [Tanacetum coccineum]
MAADRKSVADGYGTDLSLTVFATGVNDGCVCVYMVGSASHMFMVPAGRLCGSYWSAYGFFCLPCSILFVIAASIIGCFVISNRGRLLGITDLKITKPIRRNEERRNNEGPNICDNSSRWSNVVTKKEAAKFEIEKKYSKTVVKGWAYRDILADCNDSPDLESVYDDKDAGFWKDMEKNEGERLSGDVEKGRLGRRKNEEEEGRMGLRQEEEKEKKEGGEWKEVEAREEEERGGKGWNSGKEKWEEKSKSKEIGVTEDGEVWASRDFLEALMIAETGGNCFIVPRLSPLPYCDYAASWGFFFLLPGPRVTRIRSTSEFTPLPLLSLNSGLSCAHPLAQTRVHEPVFVLLFADHPSTPRLSASVFPTWDSAASISPLSQGGLYPYREQYVFSFDPHLGRLGTVTLVKGLIPQAPSVDLYCPKFACPDALNLVSVPPPSHSLAYTGQTLCELFNGKMFLQDTHLSRDRGIESTFRLYTGRDAREYFEGERMDSSGRGRENHGANRMKGQGYYEERMK